MDRFVAMIWDQEDLARQSRVNSWSETLLRQSPKWTRVLDAPGLRVFSHHHRGDGPVVTRWQGDDGVVIGVLFERGGERKGRVQNLDRREALEVAISRGDRLIRNYWGNYVAIWREACTRKSTVLRDPCAAVPCFMTRQHGIELLFAHAEDVAGFRGLSFTIDWTFLQAFLIWDYFATRHTGLREAKEVQAGQRVEIANDGEKRFSWAWDGVEVASEPNMQSFDEARAELRATAEMCFAGWGKEYRNIIVRLSGGLDSSIVLNLLRSVSDAKITAQHLVAVGYEAYEQKLARLSAAKAGVELMEPQVPAGTDFRRMLNMDRLMRPTLHMTNPELDDILIRSAETQGADAFMGGKGGDQLFMQRSGGAHALSDFVQLNGLRWSLWRVAYETAMLRQSSVWKAVTDTIDSALLHRAWRPNAFLQDERRNRGRPLRQEIVDAIPDSYLAHPWLVSAARLPHGASGRVSSVVTLSDQHVRQGYGFAHDAIFPFFCQPLVEFVLRTPTYVFGRDGLDRALERLAFADLIPDPVFRRTSKGGVSHTMLKQLSQNADFCRELILDGALARHGWIDRSKVEQMLTEESMMHGVGAVFIRTLAAVEAWIMNWHAEGARVAA
jgi:asparagine synthase (glutamine-hydrolysing)